MLAGAHDTEVITGGGSGGVVGDTGIFAPLPVSVAGALLIGVGATVWTMATACGFVAHAFALPLTRHSVRLTGWIVPPVTTVANCCALPADGLPP
jgi:hypothetical protein